MTQKQRLIIGISGASGAIYGIKLLEVLRETDIETHVVISKMGAVAIAYETDYKVKDVEKLADIAHPTGDLSASISSGSFQTMGMIIAPCSMRSLGEIALGTTGNLLTRAADVCLKERRRVVLLVRETPLSASHIRNMQYVTEMGGIIAPPVPAFYTRPTSLEDVVNHTVGRTLDLFGLKHSLTKPWEGLA